MGRIEKAEADSDQGTAYPNLVKRLLKRNLKSRFPDAKGKGLPYRQNKYSKD